MKYGEGYKQKSYIFLYPLLRLGRDTVYKPDQTYLFYDKGKNTDFQLEDIENFHLIVHFKESGNLFNIFENSNIKTNENLTSCYQVQDGRLYIFDLIAEALDVAHFIYGDYSMMSDKTKARIMGFHNYTKDGTPSPEKLAHIGLYPEKYYKLYADQFGYPGGEKEIKSINKELIPKIDKDLETYKGEIIRNLRCVPERPPMRLEGKKLK